MDVDAAAEAGRSSTPAVIYLFVWAEFFGVLERADERTRLPDVSCFLTMWRPLPAKMKVNRSTLARLHLFAGSVPQQCLAFFFFQSFIKRLRDESL